MVEPSISVTIALEPFATSVSHPCLMLMSPTWTSCALPAMNRYSRGAIFHTMSVPDLDVNMDYSICNALEYHTEPMNSALIIYDVACQWSLNFHRHVQDSHFLSLP